MTKQSSEYVTELASAVMRGHVPSADEVKSLAASVLAQREKKMTPGKRSWWPFGKKPA